MRAGIAGIDSRPSVVTTTLRLNTLSIDRIEALILMNSIPSRCFLVVMAALCACADPPPSVYPTQRDFVEDNAASASDILEIRVAKQEALSGDFEIDADGKIAYPMLGVLELSGKSAIEISQLIQSGLADDWIRNPQVTVRIKERRSKRVSVFGEVRKGTVLSFIDGMTITDAIANAGGFTPRAWENAVKVTRKSGAKAQEFTVPVNRIANGNAAPFYMRPGDSVFVPKSPI